MKYTGNIFGFKSSFGSIYNIVIDDTKCYAWRANIVASTENKILTLSFNWNGAFYELKLSLLKDNYYTGKIFYNQTLAGEAFLWSFKKDHSLLLKGDFIEDDAGTYDCIIDLRPLNTS